MLKITIHGDAKAETMQLEGKIVGPWVDELSRAWQSLAPSLGSKELCLDLRGVAFVDSEGVKLLSEIYRKANARFLADSPLMKYFADEAAGKFPKNREKGA
jgi:ABC-type transporter Mla MlaB component